MIWKALTRVGAVVTAVYLTFYNPTLLGDGTPLFALAVILLFLMDISGLSFAEGGGA